MKNSLFLLTVFLVALTAGCESKQKFHPTDMPNPESFNAHFGDMDANGDEFVSREEFGRHFNNPDPKVFDVLDLNRDGNIDHDEWHKFKEAHGLKHRE